ncbi:MAG: heparinase II/III domain-containing protein [Planctomycetota bacterium]|jgi:hypothetical protein
MARLVATVCLPAALLLPVIFVQAAEPQHPGQKVLAKLDTSHPRLILKDDALARLKKAIDEGADEILQKCCRDVIKRADGYLDKAPPEHKKVGPRLLLVSRDCLRRTYALALAYRLTGEAKYAKAARENLLAVCAFADWNPSHFLDTAEMSHAVGIGYDWLFDYLDEPSRKAIRQGLIRNALKPGIAAYAGRRPAWWTNSAFNWNQVCNGGLIIGALAVAETDPQYAEKIIGHALKSLPKALASYAPDGAWGEGPSYWSYATRYTVYALAALKTAVGTDFGLSRAKGLDVTGFFPIYTTSPTGLYFNFADCGERSRRRNIPCLLYLARRYGHAELAHAEYEIIRRRRAEPEDLIWYRGLRVGDVAEPPLDKLFRGPVAVAVFRSAWDDPDAMFVAVKAGYNRVNHGHLDLGNFEFDALGVRWARDLGSDDYNLPGYWDGARQGGKRWTYYRLNSKSHNVCTIDGRDQNVEGKAKFVKFGSTRDTAFAVVDLTSAYAPAAGRALRGVAVTSERTRVLIQDEFSLPQKCRLVWAMTTDAEIKVEKSRAVLEQSGKRLHVEIVSPAGAAFTVESAEQEPPQKPNKGVKRLVIRLENVEGDVRLAVLFTPAWPVGELPPAPELKPLADW